MRELATLLEATGAEVRYAIHPVAGRMPGHMNVRLAEADVPYEQPVEMDAINPTIATTDVAIVVGANDAVNPAAREDKSSPIYGMPVINVDEARTVFVLKRSMASGFAGIENPLFFKPNTGCSSAMPKPACKRWWGSLSRVRIARVWPDPRFSIRSRRRVRKVRLNWSGIRQIAVSFHAYRDSYLKNP